MLCIKGSKSERGCRGFIHAAAGSILSPTYGGGARGSALSLFLPSCSCDVRPAGFRLSETTLVGCKWRGSTNWLGAQRLNEPVHSESESFSPTPQLFEPGC